MFEIVTYCSNTYVPCLNKTIGSWISSGTKKIHIYTDKNSTCFDVSCYLNENIHVYAIQDPSNDRSINCKRKFYALENCLNHTEEQCVLLLDVDCFITGSLSSMCDEYVDIAVTTRKESKKSNDISAGFILVQKNKCTKQFMRELCRAIENDDGPSADQSNLTRLLKQAKFLSDLHLDYKEYNFYPDTNSVGHITKWKKHIAQYSKSIKVIHFAHGLWKDTKLFNEILESLNNGK